MQPYMNRPEVWAGPEHGHRGLGFVLFILLLIALAALIGYVVARLAAGRRAAVHVAAPAGDEPLTLLRLRYARGEIDRETFLQTSADLGGLPPPAAA